MFTPYDLWAGFLVPMFMTAAVLFAAWSFARRRLDARASRSWAAGLAIGIGFAGGYCLLFGWNGFPPAEATDWLLFLTLPLAALAMLEALLSPPPPVRLALTFIAVALAVLLLGWPILIGQGKLDSQAALRLAVVATASLAWIVAMDALAVRASATRTSAILLAAVLPASVTLLLSGSQRLGQAAGVLAAAQAGALAANLSLGRAGTAQSAVLVFGILYAGLLLSGNLYAELTTANAIILFIAPILSWIAHSAHDYRPSRVRSATQVALVAATSSLALLRAWMDFAPDAPY